MNRKELCCIQKAGLFQVFVSGGAAGSISIASGEEMSNRGVTLIELLVVISVIACLAIALGFSYADWIGKYKVEKATKELYTDLMYARSMAMTASCDYFVDFNFPPPPAGRTRMTTEKGMMIQTE